MELNDKDLLCISEASGNFTWPIFVLVQNFHRITHFYHHTAQLYLCVC